MNSRSQQRQSAPPDLTPVCCPSSPLCYQLDEMCITFDGGRTRLNFAEAALLIQGSACIYSKKVCVLQ